MTMMILILILILILNLMESRSEVDVLTPHPPMAEKSFYERVQAYHPEFRQPRIFNAACSSNSNATYLVLYHADHLKQCLRVT